MMTKPIYYLGAALCVLAAQPALAQEAAPADETAAGTTDATDIVVTAQRREQRLLDVPVAVSAVSSLALQKANIDSAMDIGKVASGVIFQPNATAVTAFIRGMGNNQTTVGNEASNALYVDGIYYTRISPGLLRLNNVERIEVLKGPQGTLFGRNATGGLINIVTSDPKPGSRPELNFFLNYANYQTVEAGGYLAAGLGEKVAASVSVFYRDQGDGWGTNFFDGSDLFYTDEFSVRGKMRFELSETTTITASADYNKSKSNKIGSPGRHVGAKPTLTGVFGSTEPLPQLPSRYDDNTNLPDQESTEGYGGYLRIEQDLNFATLIATGAYHKEISDFQADLDGTPQTAFHYSGLGAFSKQTSGELQLQSNPGSAIDYTLGFFYLKQDFGYPKPARIFGTGLTGAPVVGTLRISDGGENESYAVYGQASFDIAPRLRGTVGLRYTWDKTQAYGDDDFLVGDVVVADAPRLSAKDSYGKLTWRGALDYKPSDNMLLYASISRGTKAGNFAIVTFDPTPIKPEVLDAYEIGAKARLFGGLGQISAAIFYYDLKNPQVQIQSPDSGVTRLVNADSASIKGAEIEATLKPSDMIELRAGATYLDAKYEKYEGAPFFVPNPNPPFGYSGSVPGDASGNRLSRAPKFSANAGFTFTLPVGDDDAFELSGNYSWTGRFFWNPDNLVSQKGYGLLDGQVAYSIQQDRLRLELWGSNLTNTKYNVAEQQFGNFLGTLGSAGAPRTYGVRLRFKYR